MLRLGMTIGIRSEKIEEYEALHSNVWPEILKNLTELNFKNYSIFRNKLTLFAYVEYHGDNFERDIELMANNKIVQQWWSLCNPCQIPDENRRPGEWWTIMDEIFYHP